MADDQDVIAAGSSPADPDPTPDVTAAPTSPAPSGDDRPVHNAVAEFNRKFAQVERRLNDVLTYVATQRPAAPTSAAPAQDVTDEDLWRLAQQGDRNAFDLYMERKATRVSQSQYQTARLSQAVDAQLQALSTKYPVFNDATHPLTQAVNQTYSVLVQSGYPQSRATLLDAMKTAIADRPDLVAELHGRTTAAPAAVRQSAAARAQAGATGVSHRESPAPVTPARITPAETALAARMGVKDPGKSKQRFQERMDKGQSALGSVAAFVKDEAL